VGAKRATRGASLRARCLLSLASALVALLGLELYLRARPRPRAELPTAVSLCRPLEDATGLRYELVPDQVATHALPAAAGEPPRSVTYTINAGGYRGELAPEKPAGELRVAVVGDSFVFGSLVGDAETLPAQLEELLEQRLGEGRVRVINLGVPGYQLRQLVQVLEQRVARLEPDLVLLDLYVNDTIPTADTYDGRAEDPDPPPATRAGRWIERLGLTSSAWPPSTPRERVQALIRRRSALADVLAEALFTELEGRDRRADHVHRWRAEGAGWQSVRAALTRAAELARRDGYTLHVSMFPSLAWIDERPYPLADAHARLAAFCAELALPFHDLLPAFAGRDPRPLWAHELDQHPSAAGHRLAAELLAERLLAERSLAEAAR
jgi:lysophospholipase L1-like esterase